MRITVKENNKKLKIVERNGKKYIEYNFYKMIN